MKVLEIRVLPEQQRLQLVVQMPLSCFHTSQVPHLPSRLFSLLPGLAEHTCHNDDGIPFHEEACCTEIPHLFEHLLVELQLQAQHAEDLTLRGMTEWNWHRDPHGLFHVEVEYENELLAVGAIRLAERMLFSLDQRNIDTIDMSREIELLRQLADLGRAVQGVPNQSRQPLVPDVFPGTAEQAHRRFAPGELLAASGT